MVLALNAGGRSMLWWSLCVHWRYIRTEAAWAEASPYSASERRGPGCAEPAHPASVGSPR